MLFCFTNCRNTSKKIYKIKHKSRQQNVHCDCTQPAEIAHSNCDDDENGKK